MRHLGYALLVVVCSWSVAFAQPKKKGGGKAPAPPTAPAVKKVDPKVEAELMELDKKWAEAMGKQAHALVVKHARKAYELQVKATGATSIEARRRKDTLASALLSAGNYTEAEKLYGESVRDTEKEKGAESREVMYALTSLRGVYYAQLRYDDADPIHQRILAISKKVNGAKSKEYAQDLSFYASMLQIRNEYTSAVRYGEEALQIHEAVAKSKDDQELAAAMQSLANLYWAANQHAKAIALFDRVIAIYERSKDVMPIVRVSTLYGVGMQYQFGGRKDLAQKLFAKAITVGEQEIAIAEKKDATATEWSLSGLYNLVGAIYRYAGDLDKAEQSYNRAIAWAKKHNIQSGLEGMVADIKRMKGQAKEALAIYEKAAADYAKMGPDFATIYNTTIADIAVELKDYKKAEKLLDDYSTYMGKKWGKKSIFYGSGRMAAVYVYAESGKLKQAEQALDEALDIQEMELSKILRSGTDVDHAVYFSKYGHVLYGALNFHMNFAPTSGSASRLALTTLLRRKGRVLDAAAASLATLRQKLSPADKKLLDELNSARAQLAKLTVAGPAASGDANAYAKEVAALEDKIQKLELQISKKSAAYRTVTQPVELAAVQKVIPKDARLVEIINYQPYDKNLTYAQKMAMQFKPRRYAAYIVGNKGDPSFVDLGEAAAIDQAIEQFRKALADPDNDLATDLGKSLFDLTMAKIVPKLGGATHILIAPDGSLNVVPFSALVDDKKEFLIKKYTFTYLTSGRDLLRVGVNTKAKGGGVLFADPKFDSTGPAPAGGGKPTTRGSRSADLASLKWEPLPGTAAEADAVVKTFKGLKVFRGDQATEGALKGVKAPKVLHLATHGFFLPDEKPPENQEAAMPVPTPAGPMGGGPAMGAQTAAENPLLRSGLALAGANKLASGDDDGVLTALEASGLDLLGTKLVVLSACETGVGKVSNGDGVYGLRRSLVIAGAESLVMSLWQVDDFATKELMSGFYKRLSDGKPRSAALRDVQLELLSKPKYAHPFYWAAFLPAGATTPLKD